MLDVEPKRRIQKPGAQGFRGCRQVVGVPR